jgi:hypothetical protein
MNAGLDGIVLTNHYYKAYVKDGDYVSFACRYTEEFHRAREYGDRVGAKVFFGAEVTMEKHNLAHVLIYGIDENFIESNPTLFDLTQEEFYNLVKLAGGTVASEQAVPEVAALGLILTLVAVPLTFVVKALLDKFGPSED